MIHHYHYGHPQNLKFWYAGRNDRLKETSPEGAGSRLMLGFELEVEGFTSTNANRCSDYTDEQYGSYTHCESDGSLHSGASLEVITQPMTLQAHKLVDWRTMLQKIDAFGGKSHDAPNAALHVHLSRKAFGSTPSNQALAIGKLLELEERFRPELIKLARRNYPTISYCKPNDYNHRLTDRSDEVRTKATTNKGNTDRYVAINLTNTNTVEIRIFKGTLKYETLMATLALCNGLVRYVVSHTLPEIHTISISKLIEYINDETLTEYAKTRGVE